jgi:hypothetical protein
MRALSDVPIQIGQSELFPEGIEEIVTVEGIESRLNELGWAEV